MKKSLFPIFLFLFCCVELRGQCYPVFDEMVKQPPKKGGLFSQNLVYRTPYKYFYTTVDAYDPVAPRYGYSIWNDTGWISLPDTPMYGGGMRLHWWGNRIIGNGLVKGMGSIKAPTGKYYPFWEYKNGAWDTLPGVPPVDSTYFLWEVQATETGLFYCYEDYKAKTGQVYMYDTTLGRFKKIIDFERAIYGVGFYGGTNRVVLSNVVKINGAATKGFCYIDGDTVKLNSDANFDPYMIYGMDGANDYIYAFDYGSNPTVRIFSNKLISKYATKLNVYRANGDCQIYKGKIIWLTVDIEDNWYKTILCPGETKWKNIGNKNWYNANVSQHGIFCMNTATSKILELGEGAAIEGMAYMDMDSNCNWDSTKEQPLRNNIIQAKGSNYQVSTRSDANGNYDLYVIPDNYVISGPGKSDTPCGIVAKVPKNDTIVAHDVPTLRPGFYDLKARLLNFHAVRWNSVTAYNAHIQNIGEAYDSGYFEFHADPRIRLLPNPGYYDTSGSVARGKLRHFEYFDERLVHVYAWIDSAKTKQDSIICNEFISYLYTAEKDSSNNGDSICQRVVYSFDPNHKECDKASILPKKSTPLEYFIGFQNEGNDIAEDIVLRDTLSFKLNLESLQVLGGSHAYTMELQGNILTITFAKINLKPKKESELLSQGYFSYSINSRNDLNEGDSIRNRAAIYFDLNKPVITNWAVTKVTSKLQVKQIPHTKSGILTAYPNPANSILHIYTADANSTELVQVYSATGELIASAPLHAGIAEFQAGNWPAGLYIAKTSNARVKLVITK